MRDNLHPLNWASEFEDWCIDCKCSPGDAAFKVSLSVAFENFIRKHMERLSNSHQQLANAFIGLSLSDENDVPHLSLSIGSVESKEERLKGMGDQLANAVFGDIRSRSFNPSS